MISINAGKLHNYKGLKGGVRQVFLGGNSPSYLGEYTKSTFCFQSCYKIVLIKRYTYLCHLRPNMGGFLDDRQIDTRFFKVLGLKRFCLCFLRQSITKVFNSIKLKECYFIII